MSQKEGYEKLMREYNALLAEMHTNEREKVKVESGIISLEKKISESEASHVKAKNAQQRFDEENQRLKAELSEHKAKYGTLQEEQKKLGEETADQKRNLSRSAVDLERLNQEVKMKAKEVMTLRKQMQQLESEKKEGAKMEMALREELRNAAKYKDEVIIIIHLFIYYYLLLSLLLLLRFFLIFIFGAIVIIYITKLLHPDWLEKVLILIKRKKALGTRLTIKFKMAACSAIMQSFRFTNDLWDTILNKLRCKYFEVSTENTQNENVYCQVMRQDAFKDMCEYEASI